MKKQLIIRGCLCARTGFSIGTGSPCDYSDAPVKRSSDGRLVIPGGSLAGLLRSIATALAPAMGSKPCIAIKEDRAGLSCDCSVCRLMGSIRLPEDSGSASRLWVYDAYMHSNGTTYIRDRIGIDRATKTAASAAAAKFDLEVVSAGSCFDFRLAYEYRKETGLDEESERLLVACLAEWQEGRLYIGGGAGRGLGAFILKDLEVRNLGLSDRFEILSYLQQEEPWETARPSSEWLEDRLKDARLAAQHTDIFSKQQVPVISSKCMLSSFALIETTLDACDLFLVSDVLSAGRSSFYMSPLIENNRPLLPGSVVRGVLRSLAERIARTLWIYDYEQDKSHLCPACHAVGDDANAFLASCGAVIKASIKKNKDVQVGSYQECSVNERIKSGIMPGEDDLCLACKLFGSTYFGSRLRVEDAPLIGEPFFKALDFLAVDRFTGGGRSGAKFDAMALYKPSFRLRMTLTNPTAWEMGWLALLLKDLVAGELYFGWGQAKGFGQVKASNTEIVFGCVKDNDLLRLVPEENINAAKLDRQSGIFNLYRYELDSDSAFWPQWMQQWVDSFVGAVSNFTSEKQARVKDSLSKDVYRDTDISKLYPVVKKW